MNKDWYSKEDSSRRDKRLLGAKNSKSGAVTLIQRFGGSLNLNIHFHQLFVDGCYELNDKNEPVQFWVATPPTVKEIEEVLMSFESLNDFQDWKIQLQ